MMKIISHVSLMIAVLGISSGCASDARFRRDRDIASIELDASVQSAFERVLDTSNSRRAKPDCDAIAINDGMLSLSPEPWAGVLSHERNGNGEHDAQRKYPTWRERDYDAAV
jgi:hypothetical protein